MRLSVGMGGIVAAQMVQGKVCRGTEVIEAAFRQ